MAISLSIKELNNYLKRIGFIQEIYQNISVNKFKNIINGYTIEIYYECNDGNIENSVINYGEDIKIGHQGVCNLTKDEFLVQLECVIKLLKKGYPATQIELEKTYTLGHNEKGRLDILVKKENIPWMMIECKTYGAEYYNEIEKVEKNGSQIFSYYAQDRTPSIIGVYTSSLLDLSFEFYQISTQRLNKLGSDKDIFKSWNKDKILIGVLADDKSAYECSSFNIRKKDLKDLDKDNGTKLYNRFMEILRRYAISDKSNAFNVFFNLFVCKIYDEETKGDNDILDFQWKLSDDAQIFTDRLSNLYYQSIKQYLNLECDSNFQTYFKNGMLFPIKEFSFIEILNSNDFVFNTNILVEVVKLLQEFKIKYFTRQQFLGDFFENLLNKGFKQESGQFFTPHPLTRFILRSLPIDLIIKNKTIAKDPYILPYTIDFACGGGHFLTEAMLEIEKTFKRIDLSSLNGPQRRNFDNLKNNYYWAKEYIYGIEKDSRLAKTTKIAMFLNGDGDADIISADGLGDFYSNKIYKNKLKTSTPKLYNNNFNLVVSNPPFSVEGFFNTIDNLDMFCLREHLTSKSCEIECFFLERTLQLLDDNGYTGLIYPLSLLNNKNSIYKKTRELLLLNLDVYAMTEMREKAFSVTNTTTIIVFARKRSKKELFEKLKKFAIKYNISENDSEYICAVKEISERSYLTFNLKGKFVEYLLNDYSHRIVTSFSGEKKQQEFFQGYRFNKARGKEELVETNYGCLISNNDDYGTDDLATIIHSNFNNIEVTNLSKNSAKYCTYVNAIEIFNSCDEYLFNAPSMFLSSKTIKIESISPFGDFIDNYESFETTINQLIKDNKLEFISGLVYDKKDEVPFETDKIVFTASNIDLKTGKITLDTKLIYLKKDFPLATELQILENDIIISMSSGSLKHLGKVAMADKNYSNHMAGGFLSIIRCKNKELATAIYYRLMSKSFRNYVFSKKGQNINNLSSSDFGNVKINIPQDLNSFYEEVLKK